MEAGRIDEWDGAQVNSGAALAVLTTGGPEWLGVLLLCVVGAAWLIRFARHLRNARRRRSLTRQTELSSDTGQRPG